MRELGAKGVLPYDYMCFDGEREFSYMSAPPIYPSNITNLTPYRFFVVSYQMTSGSR